MHFKQTLFLSNFHRQYLANPNFQLFIDSCFYFKIPIFWSEGGCWKVCSVSAIKKSIKQLAPEDCSEAILRLLSVVFPSNYHSHMLLIGQDTMDYMPDYVAEYSQ